MSTSDPPSSPRFRLADRLAAARRGRFVGREAEIELFRSALRAVEPPFAVLHLYGPGGVGKSTLLREYGRLALEANRPAVLLDRDIEPSPPGFLLALRRAIGLELASPDLAPAEWPPNGVLLIDTYELLEPLDGWLREVLLPQLPGHTLTVIAGRNRPAMSWRTDLAWAGLTRVLPLRNLRPEESQAYLVVRGVPDQRHPEVLTFTHGHPLALSLVADVLTQGEPGETFDIQTQADTVRVLLERFVRHSPGDSHRLGLQVCALSWATTEDLLTVVLSREEAHRVFEWLATLSFIERGPYGLFPHDLAREVLEADYRWRNPDSYREIQLKVRAYLSARFQQTTGREQQRLWLDILYLGRNNPGLKSFFAWGAMDFAYAEPAGPGDLLKIIDLVQEHEGQASAEIARYWLRRQPRAFLAFRTPAGSLSGFMANLELHQVTAEDMAADPAVPAALDFAGRYGPVRAGEEIVYLRFWMAPETYQAVSPALNLTAINSVIYWLTHPALAWNFIAFADPDFIQPHFASLNIQRSPEADFEVDGRRYGVFSHDWRVEPASIWQMRRQPAPLPAPAPAPVLVLSQPEFEEAVRQALRDYSRPDQLAVNPLMRSRLVVEATEPPASVAALQTILREAVQALTGNPRDEKLHRALYHTYLVPAPTQEQAAERLGLPFNTYRYHLTNGLRRITAWLWQRETR